MAANKNEATDSISIIEDCLNRIYLARRANLMNKARKFKEKQSRKQYGDVSDSPVKKTIIVDDSALSDYAEGSILEELGTKFRAPITAAVPYVKENSNIAQKYQQQDQEAHDLLINFCDDLSALIDDAPMRIPDDDFRADNCDLLIHKYLTNKMDKMMATKTLSKIRKHISTIIEQFAASDDTTRTCQIMDAALKDCRESFGAGLKAKNSQQPVEKSATAQPKDRSGIDQKPSSTAAAATAPTSAAPPRPIASGAGATKAVAQAAGPTSEERQKAEKLRIKAQYEQLMTIKKKAENHPDDDTIHQYSALHADIQSVIDSINVNKGK